MDNFDLRKHLSEGKLLKENLTPNDLPVDQQYNEYGDIENGLSSLVGEVFPPESYDKNGDPKSPYFWTKTEQITQEDLEGTELSLNNLPRKWKKVNQYVEIVYPNDDADIENEGEYEVEIMEFAKFVPPNKIEIAVIQNTPS